MQRRSLLKLAAGAAAGSALAMVPERISAEVEHVGTGCINCRPDLFPAHGATLPIDANHHKVDWMRWTEGVIPTITIGGYEVKQVTELYTGPNGWLIRNAMNGKGPDGKPQANLCPCTMLNVEQSLYRGPVAATNLESLTVAEIMAAQKARDLRDRRWQLIDEFLRFYPTWTDAVYAEQRYYPDMVPYIKRDVLQTGVDWERGVKTYMPGIPYLAWKPMDDGA